MILSTTDEVRTNLADVEEQLKVVETDIKESTEQNTELLERKKEIQREIWQLKALLRNLNLLILDVFKEFD